MLASKNFICLFRKPLLQHSTYFMQSSEKNIQEWEDRQQRAIISFYMMQGICQLRDLHRASLFNRYSIKSRIEARANQLKSKHKISQAWSLKEQNLNKVWQGFDPNRGALVNLNIWRQKRFSDVAKFERICLIPSYVTGEIFYQLLTRYFQQMNKKDFVISGEKGIGKSFAYLTYDYLSQFIVSYRMSEEYLKQPQSKRLFDFVEQDDFNFVKKLLYLPLAQVPKISQAVNHFLLQTNIQQVKQLKKISDIQRLNEVLQKFWTHYKNNHGIQILCIIDEINCYYSNFRQMLKFHNKAEKSPLQIAMEYALSEKAALLTILTNADIDSLLFNSSQSIEADLIRKWNKGGNSPQYFCIYRHERTENNNHYIKYPLIMENFHGHTFLYEAFWQNLWSNFNRLTQLKYQQKKKYLRTTFENVFQLSHDQQSKQNEQLQRNEKMIPWRINVSHLNIRSVCEKRQNIVPRIQQIIMNQQDEEKKASNFLKIKQLIERQYYLSIKERFLKFYKQSTNKIEHFIRFQIICWINSCAYNQIIQKHILDSQQNLENHENFKQIDKLQNCLVQVDFSQMLEKLHQNKNQSTEYVEAIKQYLHNFHQEVGIGYRNPNDPMKSRFYLNPVLLWKITLLLDEQFIKDSSLQFRLLIKGFQVSHYTGNHLDSLYFQLFKQFQKKQLAEKFTLILDSWRINEIGLVYNKNEYLIAQTIGFQLRRRINGKNITQEKLVNWKVQLSNVFQAASQQTNIGKYILGFCQAKDILSEDTFTPNNPIFDFVLVKCFIAENRERNFQAHFIELTCGKIQSKIQTFQTRKPTIQRLLKEMKQMNTLKYIHPANISCKFLILGPQKIIQKFLRNGMNQKQMVFYNEVKQEPAPHQMKINYGIRGVNYFIRGRHLKLPQEKKNFENLIFSTMKEVAQQLQIYAQQNEEKK